MAQLRLRPLALASAAVFGSRQEHSARLPAALANRLVNIYRNGSLIAQARCDATGIYKTTRTLGGGTFTFQARTPNDQDNLGTTSPLRQVAIR